MEVDKKVESAEDNVRKKRKRVSKKLKRSWRKNVDIKDIEDYLDEVRRQERTGGIISQKKNEELYFVHKDETENELGEKELQTARKRKLKKRKDDSSSDESSDEETKKTNIAVENNKNRTQATGHYDLWGSNDKDSKVSETIEDEHYLKITKKLPAKQPKSAYKVRSTAPALDMCHAGASYNPTFEDHQSLLTAACEVEIAKEKEINRIKRQLQLPSKEELAKLPSWEEEMSQGLFDKESDKEDPEDNDEDDNDFDDCAMLPSGGGKGRKTAKQKRKANERKKEEQNVRMLREEKAREHEVFRVRSIKKLIQKDLEKTKEREEKKQKKKLEALSKPQRLGRQKFEEMNIEIQLTDELSGNLRSLKPEGNLFEDRFKNLQRRNIIEPRRPVMPHRKYKLKEYEKRSYKNFDLQEKIKKKKK